MNLSYGIIRNIDLDVEEEEIKDNLVSDCEILSIRRLKRMNYSGKWINSETIRICFKGSTLPDYVNGYGCRFKVEPYMFPVTQCSGCWKYGHVVRYCPSRKIICPKCGENHSNCETTSYKCINCKGQHMALNRSCPVFIKEKMIRTIMRDSNCTYGKALATYLSKQKSEATHREQTQTNLPSQQSVEKIRGTEKSYRDVLIAPSIVNTENKESTEEEEDQEKESTNNQGNATEHKKSKRKRKTTKARQYSQNSLDNSDSNNYCDDGREENFNQKKETD